MSLLSNRALTTATILPCHEPATVPIPQQVPQHVLLVPVYQQQKAAVAQQAEEYAAGYESNKASLPAPPLPPPPPPPCQPCQQYHVFAAAAAPQPKPIFTPSAAFYARGGIGLGAYFSAYKVKIKKFSNKFFTNSKKI